MVRDYAFHQEIKILMSEVFRTGDMTDEDWIYKYEILKQQTPLEDLGKLIQYQVNNGFTLEEAVRTVKNIIIERKRLDELKN